MFIRKAKYNMYITPVISINNNRSYNKNLPKPKLYGQLMTDTVCFTGLSPEIVKPIREALSDEKITPQKLDSLFLTLPAEYQERIADISNAFKDYGIDKHRLFRKFINQPSMISSKADMIITRIKAHAFVERHKTGHPKEEIIPYVIDSKNLGKSADSIFMPLLINKAFASQGRPACFVDESGLENTFKRYCRKNPEAAFDKIEILYDEMSQAFIDFTRRLSQEIKGDDSLFDVSVKREVMPDNVPAPLESDKQMTVKETLAHLKYHLFETQDKREILSLYAKLPERYHTNFSALLAYLKNARERLTMYDLLPFYSRNPAFFNMKVDDAMTLIKVKQFIDKSNGKSNGTVSEVLKTGFFPSLYQRTYFSHFLASKMFPEKAKMPWYMKRANNVDLTDAIKVYLKENPAYRLEFDVKYADKADAFYNYAKGLSWGSIGRNAFKINILD